MKKANIFVHEHLHFTSAILGTELKRGLWISIVLLGLWSLPTAAFAGSCPAANPNDWADDTSALQACLNTQGTVVLDPGSPGYVISSTLYLTRNYQRITSSQAWSATILAADSFASNAVMITTAVPAPNYYTIELLTVDGRVDERSDPASCRDGGGDGNLNLDGTGYTVTRSESLRAKCGTGIAVNGSNYAIIDNYIAWNGNDSGPGSAPWADGITVLNCSGGTIAYNTLVDNTDIGIAMGGGRGCDVHHNYIWQGGKTAFAGIVVGNFERNGAGDHTGSSIRSNVIVAEVPDRLQLGLLVGPHPWTTTWEGRSHVTHNAGIVSDNDISGAVINLMIEGVEDGTVTGNWPHDPSGSNGFGNCTISLNYGAFDFGSTVIQSGFTPLLFDNSSCELR